ncbi:unnamed protein product [Coffea canephora]|uniref:Peptidase C1A papain C-terminal domain-containing protein n=1 Tax=Coffea canephora TaxID=49390 RepID=A0A068U1Y5_COFCA|nr:unnamed protein product [Coffea canephora]
MREISINWPCFIRDHAFDFFIANGEDDYPYEGLNGICDPSRVRNKNARVVRIDGYEDVPPYSEKALQKAMAHQPVSVAIEASGRAFQLYVSGIFTGACIKPLVGYGSENGKDHCVVRNSCGEKDGYFRLVRNVIDWELHEQVWNYNAVSIPD